MTVKAVKWEGNLSQYAMAADFDIQGGPSLEDYEAMFATPERVFYPIPQIPLADSPFATLADVFDVLNKANDEGATPRYSSSLTDTMYVVAFEKEDASYRVEAEVPTDVAAQLDAIDFFDEQRDEKQEALLGPLPVVRVGDLSAIIPAGLLSHPGPGGVRGDLQRKGAGDGELRRRTGRAVPVHDRQKGGGRRAVLPLL